MRKTAKSPITEYKVSTIRGNFDIQTDRKIKSNSPDIEGKEKTFIITYMSVLMDDDIYKV